LWLDMYKTDLLFYCYNIVSFDLIVMSLCLLAKEVYDLFHVRKVYIKLPRLSINIRCLRTKDRSCRLEMDH